MKQPVQTNLQSAAWLAVGLMLLAPSVGHCDALTGYSVQVLAKVGQAAGGLTPHGYLGVGQLNDHGQLVLATTDSKGQALLGQWSMDRFNPIAEAGSSSPGGKTWPTGMGFWSPVSMNEAGNVAFMTTDATNAPLGVYLWDAMKQTVIPVAEAGMPAVNDLVFAKGGDTYSASINNHDEVAFAGYVKLANSPSSGKGRVGIFLRRADGQIQEVAVDGDPIPATGGSVIDPGLPSISDAGVIAYSALNTAKSARVGFLWESGSISVLEPDGTEIPGFGKLIDVIRV